MSILKFDNQIKGIRCQLYNLEKQNEFNKSKEKVKKYLKLQSMKLESILPNVDDITSLDETSKIILYNNLIVNNNLKNIDLLAYSNKLKEILSPKITTKLYTDIEANTKMYLKVKVNQISKDNQIEYTIDLEIKKIIEQNSNWLV